MKIQPIDSYSPKGSNRNDPVKPVAKSRLKRLFERQFPSVLRNNSAEKVGDQQQSEQVEVTPKCPSRSRDGAGSGGSDSEPSSVCLAKMVRNFIEENEKQAKCGRARCNCFNGNCNDSSDDELEPGDAPNSGAGFGEACEILKSLVPCASMLERNLLADTAKVVDAANQDKNKICRRKEDCSNACLRKIVRDGLLALGYDASICKSRWDQSHSHPAGEYEYIDVIAEGTNGILERFLIDIDFKSEFEIVRSTGHYRAILQLLPSIFVGKADRLQQIVSLVSEAAKQSLKKKGLHFPPWRKSEYMRAKWLSPYKRTTSEEEAPCSTTEQKKPVGKEVARIEIENSGWGSKFAGEFEVQFRESPSEDSGSCSSFHRGSAKDASPGEKDQIKVVVSEWQPPAIKPKASHKGAKIVTGLASVLRENPSKS